MLVFKLYLAEIWSRIHERTILLRFVGMILWVLRFEVSVYSVYITDQFQTTFFSGGGGGGSLKPGIARGNTFGQITSKKSANVQCAIYIRRYMSMLKNM